MARLRLSLPERAGFETKMAVRITDINYGQHLGNDTVLSFIHEARARFLALHGWSEKNAGGPGLIMLDAEIAYRAQAYWGDELRVEVITGEARTCDFDLFYRIVRDRDGMEIARAKTTLACYNYEKSRVVRIPESFRKLLQNTPSH